MKQFYIYTLLLIAISIKLPAESSLQQKAEKAFNDKNYKETIILYEGLIKQDYTSYKLFYNLGNAYYKNNEIGKAIFNYERANKLEPNNTAINFNLQLARKQLIDDSDNKENFFTDSVKLNIVNTINTKAWALLGIASLILSFAFLFLYFISTKLIIKRIGFFAGTLILLVFIISFFLGKTALNIKQQKAFAIITIRETKLFNVPNVTSSTTILLHEGTKVKVIETNLDWTNIKLENNIQGWVKTQHVGLY